MHSSDVKSDICTLTTHAVQKVKTCYARLGRNQLEFSTLHTTQSFIAFAAHGVPQFISATTRSQRQVVGIECTLSLETCLTKTSLVLLFLLLLEPCLVCPGARRARRVRSLFLWSFPAHVAMETQDTQTSRVSKLNCCHNVRSSIIAQQMLFARQLRESEIVERVKSEYGR